jgi:hypothetical protein
LREEDKRRVHAYVSSRQHRPKPRAELAEVEAVDDAVAVEVEVAQVIRIAGLRAEGDTVSVRKFLPR